MNPLPRLSWILLGPLLPKSLSLEHGIEHSASFHVLIRIEKFYTGLTFEQLFVERTWKHSGSGSLSLGLEGWESLP